MKAVPMMLLARALTALILASYLSFGVKIKDRNHEMANDDSPECFHNTDATTQHKATTTVSTNATTLMATIRDATTQHKAHLITVSSNALITASSNATNATAINELMHTSQHKANLMAFVTSKDSMLAEAETITRLTASEHDRDNTSQKQLGEAKSSEEKPEKAKSRKKQPGKAKSRQKQPEVGRNTTTPKGKFTKYSWTDFFQRHKQECIILVCVCFWFIIITFWTSWGCECQSRLFDRWCPAVYDGKGSYALFCLKYMIFVIVFFPAYFWHAYWDWPRCSASEPGVRNHLNFTKHIFSESVIAMICYRRNMLLVAFLFAFSLACVEFEAFINTFSESEEDIKWEAENRPLNYSKFVAKEGLNATDNDSFKRFTLNTFTGIARESMKTTSTWHQIGEGIRTGVALLTTFALGRALIVWDEYNAYHTQVAWFISIFGPFLSTAIPLKNFINMDGINAIALEYDAELQKFTEQQVEHFAKQALEACEKIHYFRASGFLTEGVETIHSVCSSIRKFTPNRHVRCCRPLFKIIDAPFNLMHSTCDKMDTYLEQGNVDQAKYALKTAEEDICMTMNADFKKMASGEKKSASSEILQHNVVSMIVKQIGIYERAVTTGLMCFTLIIVPALAIGQGMLRASWAVKLIVPQSGVPGLLILILPWLFCPFIWAIYTMIYQFELSDAKGQSYIFYTGLLVMAASGLFQTFGGLWIKVQKPMNDSQAESAYVKLSFGVIIIYGIGLVCVLYYVVIWVKVNAETYFDGTDTFDLLTLLSQHYFSHPLALLSMAVMYFNDFFLTQMAATDFLASSIAQQWMYDMEEDRRSKDRPPQRSATVSGEVSEEETAIMNAHSRVERLDCLVWVNEKSMEKVVKDAERRQSLECRQKYIPGGGAYQYSHEGYQTTTYAQNWATPASPHLAPPYPASPHLAAPGYASPRPVGGGYGDSAWRSG